MPHTSSQPAHPCSGERPGLHPDVELARLAKALAHPSRIRLLRRLAGEARCFYGSLADELPLAASTVSQHLRILRDAGLVRGEVDGPRTCYCINRDRLDRAMTLLQELAWSLPRDAEALVARAACGI
jgi:ArsR family transcriptional regulator